MAAAKRRKIDSGKGMYPGYCDTIEDQASRQRYKEKVTSYLCGQDPYELPVKDWDDDVDLWPSVTYVDIGMYLLFSNSPYTQDQLKDYKNLDCYQKFANGWVREVFVKKLPDQTLVLIGKVCVCIKLSSNCPSSCGDTPGYM